MTEPLTAETLVYRLRTAADPQVSPDGGSVAYVLSSADANTKEQTAHIWVCGIDGSAPRQVTQAGSKNRHPRWSPDGGRLAFVSNRACAAGPEHSAGSDALFILAAEGPAEAIEVARHVGEIGPPAWSPDGTQLAYTAPFDPTRPQGAGEPPRTPPVLVTNRIDYKQDGAGFLANRRAQVYVLDQESGEEQRLTTEAVDHEAPQWSPDGRLLAVRIPNRNRIHSQLALVTAGDGETKRIGPPDGMVSTWAWSPSGDRVAFTGDTEQTWHPDFFVYDVKDEAVRRVTSDLRCLPGGGIPGLNEFVAPVWLDDRRLLFPGIFRGASGLYTINVDSGDVHLVHECLSTDTGFGLDAAKRRVAQARSSFDSAGEIVLYDRETGEESVITRLNAGVLEQSLPARWEKFEVELSGETIDVWLLKPPEFVETERYPVVLTVHGGPHSYYGYAFQPLQQCLATHGFLVVAPNPRGSGSYGRGFAQAVVRDWGGEDWLDLLAALDAVLERPYADPQRVAIWGYSYGGYMTALAIGRTDRFKAAVCGAPCFDLESMFGTSDIGHSFGTIQWGGAPHEATDWYAARSPSTFAHQARTPTLIIHGEADERCPIGQGEQMFIALKRAGCEVEFARYPGASHALMQTGSPAQRADAIARSLAWIREHLG